MAQNDYKKLRELLLETETWPLLYMFKFIVPNKDGNVDKVISLLPEEGDVSFNHTKNLRHVAVTCKAVMANADEIISITREAAAIEGVLAL